MSDEILVYGPTNPFADETTSSSTTSESNAWLDFLRNLKIAVSRNDSGTSVHVSEGGFIFDWNPRGQGLLGGSGSSTLLFVVVGLLFAVVLILALRR